MAKIVDTRMGDWRTLEPHPEPREAGWAGIAGRDMRCEDCQGYPPPEALRDYGHRGWLCDLCAASEATVPFTVSNPDPVDRCDACGQMMISFVSEGGERDPMKPLICSACTGHTYCPHCARKTDDLVKHQGLSCVECYAAWAKTWMAAPATTLTMEGTRDPESKTGWLTVTADTVVRPVTFEACTNCGRALPNPVTVHGAADMVTRAICDDCATE